MSGFSSVLMKKVIPDMRKNPLLSADSAHHGNAGQNPRLDDKNSVMQFVFEGALISASSLGLAPFFGSIISHVCSYHNTITLCSHHDLYLSLGYEPGLSLLSRRLFISDSTPSDRAGAIFKSVQRY